MISVIKSFVPLWYTKCGSSDAWLQLLTTLVLITSTHQETASVCSKSTSKSNSSLHAFPLGLLNICHKMWDGAGFPYLFVPALWITVPIYLQREFPAGLAIQNHVTSVWYCSQFVQNNCWIRSDGFIRRNNCAVFGLVRIKDGVKSTLIFCEITGLGCGFVEAFIFARCRAVWHLKNANPL